jgi:hypothetical protein
LDVRLGPDGGASRMMIKALCCSMLLFTAIGMAALALRRARGR